MNTGNLGTDKPMEKPSIEKKMMELIIPAKVNEINKGLQELNGAVLADMGSLIERVRQIGLKFNSVNHPDNVPNNRPEADNGPGLPEVPSMPSDGLEGALNNLIYNQDDFIRSFRNNIYPQMDKYLGYIEKHI